MPKALCAVLGFCAVLPAAAELAEAQPTILTAQDMDAITAGQGALAHISTGSPAIASARQRNQPSIVVTVSPGGGNPGNVNPDDVSTAISVSTSGEPPN